jgi:hypothetical protein
MRDFIAPESYRKKQCRAGTLARHGRASGRPLAGSATDPGKPANVSNSFQIIATSYRPFQSLTPISHQESI